MITCVRASAPLTRPYSVSTSPLRNCQKEALPTDVFLGAHGSYYDMAAKYPKLKDGGENPFIDTAGYKTYIAEREAAFKEELKKQQDAAKAGK